MKRFLGLMLIIINICLLCSCHGSLGEMELILPDEFDETQEYNISFWAKKRNTPLNVIAIIANIIHAILCCDNSAIFKPIGQTTSNIDAIKRYNKLIIYLNHLFLK